MERLKPVIGTNLGLFRLLFRLLISDKPRKARYHFSPPPRAASGDTYRKIAMHLSRSEVAKVEEETGASMTGACWVIDGDTIDIGGKRIRLAGIDAPEMDDPYGRTAKYALIQLCKGEKITAVFEGSSSYERNTATCYLPDGRDLAGELVKVGLAIDWPKYSGGKYSELEVVGVRKKLWRCDARQKGRMPQLRPGQD